MKAYKKSELVYKNGYIMKGNKVVCVSPMIVGLFNKIETDLQKASWNSARKNLSTIHAGIMDSEFERESEHATICFEADTPTFDEHVERTMKIMHEIDTIERTNKANEYVDEISPVVEFVSSDVVFSVDGWTPVQFDLPTIGNPLEVDRDKLTQLIGDICM